MIADMLVGLVVMVLCLALQTAGGLAAIRYFKVSGSERRRQSLWSDFSRLAIVMILLMTGIIVQMIAWALLYRLYGEFGSFEAALYFSGVSFTSLGYGDLLLSPGIRLLGPLEAANGMLMFGMATAIFISAIQHIGQWRHAATSESKPKP